MLDDLLGAFGFLTILPVGPAGGDLPDQPGRMYAYFPLAGLLIGGVAGLVGSLWFFPRDVSAFLALAAWVAMTGGLHLDGLADSCDGLLSAASPERRREIMKDPRAGSWAVIGVALVLLGKWVALRAIPPIFLLIPPVAGRWAMVIAAAAFPRVSAAGLAARFGAGFGRAQLIAASVISLAVIGVLAFAFSPWIAALAVVPSLAALGIGRWAAGRLGGGLTGDVYGAICELTELLCLIGLVIHA